MGQPMLANLAEEGLRRRRLRRRAGRAGPRPSRLGATRGRLSPPRPRAGRSRRSRCCPRRRTSRPPTWATAACCGGVAPASLCVDMSTIDPSVSRRVAAALRAQAASASRRAGLRRRAARRRTARWPSWSAATRATWKRRGRCWPRWAPTSSTWAPWAAARSAKLCNNLIAGVAAVAVSEAFRIAEGFGVDPQDPHRRHLQVVGQHLGDGGHASRCRASWPRAASSRDYAPGFMTDLMAKDLGLAVNAARELRVPVIVAPAAQQALRLASSHGYGRKDFTSIYLFLKPSNHGRACLTGGPRNGPQTPRRSRRPGGAGAPLCSPRGFAS